MCIRDRFHPDFPGPKELVSLTCSYELADRKLNVILVVEDLHKGYDDYMQYILPSCKKLIEEFRQRGLPIVWTNWARVLEDEYDNAIDRFYGPRGITGPTGETNPCYVYGKDAPDSIDSIAPIDDNEWSRSIVSYHRSKWADLDENGNEILYPMCQAWGVDTVIVCGGWTDDCIANTTVETVDRYGYDCLLVSDGLATGTIHGHKMLDCLGASHAKLCTADELITHMKEHPDLIDTPKAPLHGDVRHTAPRQKR